MATANNTVLSPSKERQKKIALITDTGPETTMAFKKTFLIGDGVNSVYTISHNLNTREVVVQVRENFGDFSLVEPAVAYTSTNNVSIDMGDIIETNSYLVIVVG
jgi:hypothetical protein